MTTNTELRDEPEAGASKAEGFALKVRIGQHLEKIERAIGEVDALKTTALSLARDADAAKAQLRAIADGLAKERG